MARKRHKPEEIVAKLRQVDVLLSQGQSVADAVRSIGVSEVTEPPRVDRRLQLLRRWSHDKQDDKQVFA